MNECYRKFVFSLKMNKIGYDNELLQDINKKRIFKKISHL